MVESLAPKSKRQKTSHTQSDLPATSKKPLKDQPSSLINVNVEEYKNNP